MRALSLAVIIAMACVSGCALETGTDDEALSSGGWLTGSSVGYGVARRDTHNTLGDSIFIGYAGYSVSHAAACDWVNALYDATLKARGVRYLYCVQGPADPLYSAQEIGNSKIVFRVLQQVSAKTKFILVVGHSSGSFVAHELLDQLSGGMDPKGITKGRVVYFDLDGGESGLTHASVKRLRKAYFIGARDKGTESPNFWTMQSLGSTYGGFWVNDSDGAGCNAGAIWCVHLSLINTKPHDKAGGPGNPEYTNFAGHPVAHAFIDAKAKEAALEP